MLSRITQYILTLNRPVMVGLIFILLIAVLSCSHIPIISHADGASEAGCNQIFLANYTTTKYNILFYGLALFAFVVLVIQIKRNICHQLYYSRTFYTSLLFLKLSRFLFKLHNPLVTAFRQGILHPQIYNFFVITN